MAVEKSNINKKYLYEKMIESVKLNKHYIEECVSNDNYILWLISFLNEHGWCDNDTDISYMCLDKIEKMAKFNYFKEGVCKYAKKNYLYPIKKGSGFCYNIKYNDDIYQLYWIKKVDREACYFSKVIDNEKDLNVINFEDLLNEKIISDISFIEENLDAVEDYVYEQLFEYVSVINEKNIPLEAVEERAGKAFKRILKKLNS